MSAGACPPKLDEALRAVGLVFPRRQTRRYVGRDRRRVLFALVHNRQVNELMVPFTGMKLLPIFVDR